jgi:hypothetical protein
VAGTSGRAGPVGTDEGVGPVDLSRRRLLGSVAATGAVSVTGLGLFAGDGIAYTDSTITQTQPSVRIEWRETYNGDVVETGTESAAGPILHIDDVQPGDYGTLAFRVTPAENVAARTAFSLELTENAENGINEPERKAGDNSAGPGNGEVAEALQVDAWFDTGVYGVEQLGGCDATHDPGETTLVDGSFLDAHDALVDGVTLGEGCLEPDESACVGISWALPASTGNVVQTDRIGTDLSFTVQSCGDES